MDLALLGLGAVMFLGYTAQTVSGFGAAVITLTFSAHFLPIPYVLALLVPTSLVQCGYLAVRHRGTIDRRLLLTRILPIMGAGTVVGIVLATRLDGVWLRTLFAIMVLILAVRELAILARGRDQQRARPLDSLSFAGLLAGAGVIHGIYATGGPMLVYAVNRAGLSKAAFRSTLIVVWLVLNSLLTIGFARAGAYDADALVAMLFIAPAVPLGLLVGEHIHRRVDEHVFKIVTFCFLTGAAVSLLLR